MSIEQQKDDTTVVSETKEWSDISQPGPNEPGKLTFVPNVEPQKLPKRTFQYFPNNRIDWFKFVSELEGCGSTTAELAEMLEDVSVGPLSVPRLKQYSIFEARPANYVMGNDNFPISEPSDEAKGVHSEICYKDDFSMVFFNVTAILFFIVKVAIFAVSFELKTKYITLFNIIPVIESTVWINLLAYFRDRQIGFENYCVRELLEKSSQLAVALPRLLISECGESKFFKQQVRSPTMMIIISITLGILSFFLTACAMSGSSGMVFGVLSTFKGDELKKMELILFGVGSIIPSLQYLTTLYSCYTCNSSLKLMKTSICCNLRGFLLTQNYALDYSEVHELDEGLSYMFGPQSPTIYIPFLSIKDAFIHVEPYSVRFQYKFTRKEIEYLDAKRNERAQGVLKRGFDQSVMSDVLVWVVFVLDNELKVWTPLSLTQLQSANVSDSVSFGFCGCEIAKICRMIISQLEEDDPEVQKEDQFEEVAKFCEAYEKMRSQSIAEEALHLSCLDKIFTPGCEDMGYE